MSLSTTKSHKSPKPASAHVARPGRLFERCPRTRRSRDFGHWARKAKRALFYDARSLYIASVLDMLLSSRSTIHCLLMKTVMSHSHAHASTRKHECTSVHIHTNINARATHSPRSFTRATLPSVKCKAHRWRWRSEFPSNMCDPH